MTDKYVGITADPPVVRKPRGRGPNPVYTQIVQHLLDGDFDNGDWHLVMVAPTRRHAPIRRRLYDQAPLFDVELRTVKVNLVPELRHSKHPPESYAHYLRVVKIDKELLEDPSFSRWKATVGPPVAATDDEFAFADTPTIEGSSPEQQQPQEQKKPKGIWDR